MLWLLIIQNMNHSNCEVHRDPLIFEVSISKLICVITKLNPLKDWFDIVF